MPNHGLMRYLKLLAITLGGAIAVIGLIGVALPSVLLDFGRSLQTPVALYVVAALRVAFGAVLLAVASAARWPKTLRVFGAVIVIAGVLTPALGVERMQAMLGWLSEQEPIMVRPWVCLAIVFGAFVIYAVGAPRRSDA